jgi:hypothetical protein
MTALAIWSWSILPNHRPKGKAMWAPSDKGILSSIAGLAQHPVFGLACLVAGALGMYYFFARDLPETRREIQLVSQKLDAIQQEIRKAEERQGVSLTSHAREERSARESIGTSLKAVQADLISLKVRLDGKIDANDVHRLISKVEEITAAEAPSFAGVIAVSGKPQIASGIYAEILKGPSDGSVFYAMKDPGKYGVAKSLKALMFAKGGTWEATNTGLKVNFVGGEVTFAAKPSASKTDLVRQADLFNSLSHSVKAAGGEVINPAPIKKPSVLQRPSTQK